MNNRQQTKEKPAVELEKFASLLQDENWFAGFIQNTEENWMIQAPSHMKQETLSQLCLLPETAKEPKRIPAPKKAHSKNMQLFFYSIRVTGAVAGAILFLFIAPPGTVSIRCPSEGTAGWNAAVFRFYPGFFK